MANFQKLPEAANKENAELNIENMKENSDSNMVDVVEDETVACQMAVRDIQNSVDQRDKMEAEIVSLQAQLSVKEEENQRLCKYLEKLKKHVDQCNIQSEMYLKESETIKKLVKNRFNVHIFSKHGNIILK